MEAWFALRRISNHQIAQRRAASVMLTESKHLWLVSVAFSKALTESFAAVSMTSLTGCFMVDFGDLEVGC